MKLLKKKRPSEIILEVPRQTIGLFPEFLNALSVMSIFILAVIFYRGIQNHIVKFEIYKDSQPVVTETKPVAPAPVPIVEKSEVVKPVVEKTIVAEPKIVEAPKPAPKPVVKKKRKDITSVKSVFRFKYKKQNAVSVKNFNFFRPSSFKVSKGGKKRLRKLAPFLKGKKIIIHGHTDPVPAKFVPAREWNTNEASAKFRAQAIKKYLLTRGLKGKNVKIGKGRKIHPKRPEGSRGATFILK